MVKETDKVAVRKTSTLPQEGAVKEVPIVENIEIQQKPLGQEIPEQKVFERREVPIIEKREVREIPEQKIFERPQVQVQSQPIVYERSVLQGPPGAQKEASEVERLRLSQLNLGGVQAQTIPQKEEIKIQEQQIRQRPFINEELQYTMDSGYFNLLQTGFQTTTMVEKGPVKIVRISCAGMHELYGLTKTGILLYLGKNNNIWEWQYVPMMEKAFRDISVIRGGALFGIGMDDGLLYRLHHDRGKMELVFPGDTRKLLRLSASTERKIYAIGEDYSALYLSVPLIGKKYEWKTIGSGMVKISAARKSLLRPKLGIWAIGQNGNIFRFFKDAWTEYAFQAIDISVTNDNAIYVVGADYKLYKWNGKENFILQSRRAEISPSSQYERIPPAPATNDLLIEQIAAYEEGRVYAIEKGTGNLWRMDV